jgi:hypothetical protein
MAMYLAHMIKRHSLGPLVWRWFSGMPLDGRHRTNATWTRPSHGDKPVLHPTGHAVRWHHWPRLVRAFIRTGGTLASAAVLYGLLVARGVTLLALAGLAAAVATVATWRAWVLARQWNHRRLWVRPLHRALAKELDAPPTRLAIEPDRSKAVIGLPEEFTASDREREAITRAVTAKLAIEAPEADWSKLHGKRPQVTFVRSEPPPAKVTFADIRAEVEKAAEHEVVMGRGKRGQLVTVSVDTDSPHLGLSMGSGDGKSTVARNIACQLLNHGALALVLDYKLISHMWARGLPNVAYAGTPEEIHTALLWLQDEIQRRNAVALAGADIEGKVHANVGPRILVIAEELNATQSRLAAYWRREKPNGASSRSPASEALDEAMFIGRQVLVNVLQIGQRLSAKASGSGDARENLGVRIMKDPSSSTWKMLVGDRHALPPATGHLGRLQVVTAKAVRETQGAFVSAKDARAYAISGIVAVPRPDMPFTGRRLTVADVTAIENLGPDLPNVAGNGHPATLPPGAVSLSDAVEAGVLHAKLTAVRRASLRPGFPQPVGRRGNAHLYDVGDLHAYQASKGKGLS